MPRIRKKTSKRGTTNRRSQIKQKVAESRKKSKKAAKKNVTWKTKTPKDPGIPNNFPYKDQILAEVAEQRRQAAEEKVRRKEEKKANKAQKAAQPDDDGSDGEGSAGEGSASGFDGVITLGDGRLTKAGKSKAPVIVEEEPEAVPLLINPDFPNLRSVLDKADVVVEVLDARDPLAYRSSQLENIVGEKEGQKLLLVLNKIDTCAREPVSSWASQLRTSHHTVLFRSASAFLPSATVAAGPSRKGKGKVPANDAWGADAVLAQLRQWAQEKSGSEPLGVAVVGLTNAGKSSFINSLLRQNTLPIYTASSPSRGPTTTTHAQEVTLDSIKFIDTPGLSWDYSKVSNEDPEEARRIRTQDILLRNKGRVDKLKDPAPAISHIVSCANTEDLMLFYNLPAYAKGDPSAFLSGVARANGFIKRGGALDLAGASRLVLHDWSTGKLPRYAAPPLASAAAPAPTEADTVVLALLKPRKEARKTPGLVKFISGKVDDRPVALDAPWYDGDESEDDEDAEDEDVEDEAVSAKFEGDDEDEDDAEEEDDAEDDDEEEEEEGEEVIPSLPPSKRQRPSSKTTTPARPSKKVASATSSQVSIAKPRQSTQPKASALKGPKRTSGPTAKASKVAPASKKPGGSAKGDEYDFSKFF
ncbi:hypothetical protein BV25DRAFT_1845130 [Artomyces pyxidatus]|uniref:Uncharacterized protein n=1 Tax=Artomyces pyxidatus TaxID=48021 RepID=A0ACB8TKX0_9AGAM|nr:hypothetical protein BV25DRAFT_1845130 [Artomyces pyxidatus]